MSFSLSLSKHFFYAGPGSNRPVLARGPLKPQIEDKRKVKISRDGKKIGVEVVVNDVDVKNRKEGMDGSAESCVMYMLHHRFAV